MCSSPETKQINFTAFRDGLSINGMGQWSMCLFKYSYLLQETKCFSLINHKNLLKWHFFAFLPFLRWESLIHMHRDSFIQKKMCTALYWRARYGRDGLIYHVIKQCSSSLVNMPELHMTPSCFGRDGQVSCSKASHYCPHTDRWDT